MKRILQHVGAKDFRKTHQRKLDEQRILSEKIRREEIQEQREKEEIVKLSAPFKSSWKADLFPEEVEVEVKNEVVEVVKEKRTKLAEKWKYNWRESLIEKPEEEIVETVFEPKTFIKNIKISDSIFDNFSNVSNWREELIDEGMSSKDFPHLYGYGISIFDVPITSTIQNPVQSTLAQDIVNASAETTDYAFGPQFPGSYVNQVGGVESLSKVDAQARAGLGDSDDPLKIDNYADQDGPELPTDPWNSDPITVTGEVGSDYAKDLIVPFNTDNNSTQIFSIRLEAGKEYVFKTLDIPRGTPVDGYTWNASYLRYEKDGFPANNPEVTANSPDTVLTIQNTSGEVVAQNDDYFTGTYNSYVDSDPGDTFPQGPGGESEYYDGFGWTAAPIQYDDDGDGETDTYYYVTNSEIRYTPSTTDTYYLGLRDYFEIGSPTSEYLVRLQINGTVPAAAVASSGRSRNSTTERTTDAYDLGAPVAAFDPKKKKKKGEEGYMRIKVGDKEIIRKYDADGNYTGADTGWQPDPNAQTQYGTDAEYQAYSQQLMQRLRQIKNTPAQTKKQPGKYYGPAFGDNATANQQRMDNLYDYWKNNYKPAQQKQPFNISPITANDMPGPVKDFANNFPDYRNTEWGQNLDRLQNDPVWGPIINAGVSAVGAVAGSPQAARYAQRGMVNPLGQRATVRSGAAGRAQVPVYRGRPYQGDLKIGGGGPAFSTVDPKVAGTYTQSGPLRGTPGMAQSPQGTVDRSTLPQRYIDKYGGRSVLGQQQIKMSPSAAARTFGGTVTQPTQSKTLQNLTKVGATAAGAAAVLDAGAAEPNVSGKDLNKRISDRLPGYSIGDFAPTGKGDHYTAPILDPQGNPVMNPRTGKPVTIGGGLRGKNQYSNSALGTLTNAINDIKGGFADKTGQAKGSTKVSDTKTKPVTKTASKTQPKPSTRSTIKSMPASMMGKPSSAPAPSPQQTLNPLQTNPYKMYNYGTRGLKNIRFGYEPKGNLIAEKKMKSFKELTKQLYPGQPSPNGFPDTPPAQMSPNGYHPEYGKRGSMYNRMDRATAMAMPLTKDPEIDAKIIAARNQPK